MKTLRGYICYYITNYIASPEKKYYNLELYIGMKGLYNQIIWKNGVE